VTEGRYIARRVLTNEQLDLEVPLITNGPERSLSAVSQLSATVKPDTGRLRAADGRLLLEEWGTLLYHEVDGEIRWGGIVTTSEFQGAEWVVEAAGHATYPHGAIFSGDFTSTGIEPVEAMRMIWANLQAQPDSDLGVRIVGDVTDQLLGSTEEPYTLSWHAATDCGKELDDIVTQSGVDWVERHRWDGEAIISEIVVGYPRLGRPLPDLSFVQGENIVEVVKPNLNGDDYANNIFGLGAGEGAGSVRRNASRSTGRLRRTRVLSRKDVETSARMDALVNDELRRSLDTTAVEEIVVVDHANAPFGTFDLGDDITVEASLPWYGELLLPFRIVGMVPQGGGRLTLRLERSDATP